MGLNPAQRMFKNFLALSFAEIVEKAIRFSVVIYLARVLGPDNFGKINFASAFVSYFIIIYIGLDLLGVRELSRDKRNSVWFSNFLILRTILSCFSFLLLMFAVILIKKPLEIKILISVFGLSSFITAWLLEWTFQALEKMEYIFLSRIFDSFSYALLIFALVRNSAQLLWVPSIFIFCNLLGATLLFIILNKKYLPFHPRIDFISWKAMFMQAMPLGFSFFLVQIIYSFDTLLIGFMRSNQEVGYYSAAYKIIMFLILLMGAFQNAIFPLLSNYYKTSLASMKSILDFTAKIIITLAIPIAVGGTILSRPIVDFFYGSQYRAGITALQILFWAAVLVYVNAIYIRGLMAADQQNKFTKIVLIQTITCLLLDFILIPPWGIRGAALATLCAELIGLPFLYVEFNKILPLYFQDYILKPLSASLIMGIILYIFINAHILILIPLGSIVYVLALFVLKGITIEEIIRYNKLLQGEASS